MAISSNNVFAAFYRLPPNTAFPKNSEKLTIDGKQIRFLQETLYDDCLFQCNEDGWWLTYFNGSPNEQRFHVSFTSLPSENNGQWNKYCKQLHDTLYRQDYEYPAFLAVLIHHDDSNKEEAAIMASQAIRNSNSIK